MCSVTVCAVEPAVPAEPVPPTGTTAVGTTAELAWAAADGASFYDVYLGQIEPLELLGSTPDTAWSVTNLEPGKTYYWQIIARNSAGDTVGPRWSFETAPENTGDPGDPGDPGQDQPDVLPPACGTGACGVGFASATPLTMLCLFGLKLGLPRSRYARRMRKPARRR